MTRIDRLRTLGLFSARVPRYTSYPTAPVFTDTVGATQQAQGLAALDPDVPVSVYLHIPFCERLCWFCACRTQGTRSLAPVDRYIDTLEAELTLLRDLLPAGLRMGRMHWGGGTPTILRPALIRRLAHAVQAVLPPTPEAEFSVEIDPTLVDADKIAALAQAGMTRASIGVQDFDPQVQAAIGRSQPFDITRDCVTELRAAGIASLNADLVYGLPHQDSARLERTLDQVLSLAPDRVALFGYAHVPWMARRQALIDAETLPGEETRHQLAQQAARRFRHAGLQPIGIDHFARPSDGLARAAQAGRVRRNFQGYTDDSCPTLLGLGASSISRLPGGYVQNASATPAYAQRIAAGQLAGARGHLMSGEDALRARAIEMLMCDFHLDLAALRRVFGPSSARLLPDIAQIAAEFGDLVRATPEGLRIAPGGRVLTRIIASRLDRHIAAGGRFSQAS
ncbi:oxygen-independent coproporphyrinogen III oxidase [Pseudooceanicola aestuarii]|uniref:oxygen-independent coproporphyrinogen III oxidase n=1 Tax=Pseudooceanicola aestuarii TaxID=2697319 RepID=UPI0013D4A354|nr:oxygen-independent coproporphyrinogen III oxidase [Pseudooceanicola aestuarii]